MRLLDRDALFRSATVGLVVVAALFAGSAQAQWASQTLVLEPGWNAVFLEVQPEPRDPATVFTGVPDLESAWDWNPNFTTVEFLTDPDDLEVGASDWLSYFPSGGSAPAEATSLHAIRGGRAFLIKRPDGAAATNWTVVGTPVLPAQNWLADSYNLVGFHVDPASPPTFAAFLAPAAVIDASDVYGLDAAGQWAAVASSDAIQAGRAYWIGASQVSDYTGPWQVLTEEADAVDFGAVSSESVLTLRNATGNALGLDVALAASEVPPAEQTPNAGLPALRYRKVNPDSDPSAVPFVWADLPVAPQLSVPATGETDLRVELRRSALSASSPDDLFQGVLEVSAAGQRVRVPVRAEASGLAGGSDFMDVAVNPYTGLWVGTAAITHVSFTGTDVNLAPDGQVSGVTPTALGNIPINCGAVVTTACWAAASEAALRLIVHVDASGDARLLQEVTLLREPGLDDPETVNLCRPGTPNAGSACANDADCGGTSGACTAWTQDGTPGAEVLITDPDLLDDYSGVAVRGAGIEVGRRISTVAFALPDPVNGEPFSDGAFPAPGFSTDVHYVRTAAFVLPYDDPLNPFVHPYHPDHDTKTPDGDPMPAPGDVDYNPLTAESFQVTRQVRLTFTPSDPEGLELPGAGATSLVGRYGETLTGLHKDALHTGGTFRLHRASYASELNPTPSAPQ